MNIGASTACFYPLETEKSLQKVIDLGFNSTEIFFNSISEVYPNFAKDLKNCADAGGIDVLSVHSFSASFDNMSIFGEYQRRYDDFIDWYKMTCNAAAILGANFVVVHGAFANLKRPIPEEHYFERFSSLIEIGKQEGVKVCQENVVRFRSQDVDFLKRMRNNLGNDFNMIFDVKQAIRSGYDPLYLANEMKDSIVHLHLSDHDSEHDCLPPGKGNFDFKALLDIVNPNSAVIELYSLGYDIEQELSLSKKYFENLLCNG